MKSLLMRRRWKAEGLPADTSTVTEDFTPEDEADVLQAYQAENPFAPVTALNYAFVDPQLLTEEASSSTHPGAPSPLASSRHPASTIDSDAVNFIHSINSHPNEPLDTDPIINAIDSLRTPANPNAPPDPSTLRLHKIVFERDMLKSCPRPTFADGIFAQIVDGDDDLSHQEVDGILMPFFTIKHALTRYPTHLMPLPGTKDCRFCGEPWDS